MAAQTSQLMPALEYSNHGVGILGHLLSRHHGMSYDELLKHQIVEPLGLTSTSVELNQMQRNQLAPAHDADGKRVANYDSMTLQGNGAVCSTANDMVKFAKAHLNPQSRAGNIAAHSGADRPTPRAQRHPWMPGSSPGMTI